MNAARVLLVMPSFQEVYGSYRHLYRRGFLNPPLGLCYLASALEQAGHTARIIDAEAANLTLAQVVKQAREFAPKLIGLSSTSIDFHQAKAAAQALRQALPGTPIILGGTHVNIFGQAVLEKNPEFDMICIGDGEDLLPEVIQTLSGSRDGDLAQVKGLIWRRGEALVVNETRPIETNIDRYPFPARWLLDNSQYYRAVPYSGYQQTAAFMSSRGCPFKCIYCAVKNIHGGEKVRLRSAENVLDELEHIVKRFGIRHIAFNDDCLTLKRDRVLTICEGIRRKNLKITWEGLSRADLVDRELLKIMKDAGFVRLSIGIESGNQAILDVIRKQETLEQIESAVNLAHEVGIVTRGSVILGNPYENSDTVKDTFRFINHLKGLDQVVINILQPYPGTVVRDMMLRGEGGSSFQEHLVGDAKLQRFGSANVTVNDLTPEKLVKLQRKGFLRFYLRPVTLLNNLRISGVRTFISDGFGFMRSILGV
jgi:radical SAM superfamily enzyme YgiQ (UPF0313 family)